VRWIYISPHLDDAVLSAGGFINEQTQAGIPVEIWTIVCGYPPPGELTLRAQVEHYQWGTGTAKETIDLRRAEDLQAAGIVGAKAVHFDVPDCIYRRGPDGEALYTDIFIQPHEAEAHLPDQIAQTIAPRLRADDRVICQLGIGGHVDHLLVRQAMERLEIPLWYAADVPYVFRQPGELGPQVAGMKASIFSIAEAGLKVWIEAALAYKSQLSSLFESPDKMKEQFRTYWSKSGGLSLWTINHSNLS
jgi:LmbE family N-acetylglucosaminyl deacetylase